MEKYDEYTAGQQNFNLPHDVVPLPSGGEFYKSKKKSVKVGYLTAADENIISNVEVFKNSISFDAIVILGLANDSTYHSLIPSDDGNLKIHLFSLFGS